MSEAPRSATNGTKNHWYISCCKTSKSEAKLEAVQDGDEGELEVVSGGAPKTFCVKFVGVLINKTTIFSVVALVGLVVTSAGGVGLAAALGFGPLAALGTLLATIAGSIGATSLTLSSFVTAIGGALFIAGLTCIAIKYVSAYCTRKKEGEEGGTVLEFPLTAGEESVWTSKFAREAQTLTSTEKRGKMLEVLGARAAAIDTQAQEDSGDKAPKAIHNMSVVELDDYVTPERYQQYCKDLAKDTESDEEDDVNPTAK